MNHSLKATWVMLLIALAGAGVQAQNATPKTRDQVRNELAIATRDGSMVFGETRLPMRGVFPGRYPRMPLAIGRTRAELRVEFDAAQRSGDALAR